MDEIIYKESQKFDQKWLITLVIISACSMILPFLYGFFIHFINKQRFGNINSDFGIILVNIMAILITGIILFGFFSTRLEVKLTQYALFYRYFPFIFRFKKINYSQIRSYYARVYRPFAEFGGWGIRYSMSRISSSRGLAYTVKGKTGIQFELINGQRILFGTSNSDNFISALKQVISLKHMEQVNS